MQAVGSALSSGLITEAAVRLFAERLLKDLQRGVLFPHDLTLAALAVALAERYTPFADEYLHGLAGLQAAEMPFATRVAREVLAQRASSNGAPTTGREQATGQGIVPEDAAGSRR